MSPTKLTPLRAALALLALPWLVLWLVWRAGVAVVGLPRFARRVRAAAAPTVVCPAGHVNSAYGRWECRCGFAFVGHALSACTACGQSAGWITCARCGLGIRLV